MFSGDKTLRTKKFLLWFSMLFFGNLALLLYTSPNTLYLIPYIVGSGVITFAWKIWRK